MAPDLEALHDRLDRLDFLDRDRLVGELQLEQAAQRAEPLRLVVDQLAVFLEDLVVAGAAGVLQLVDRLRVEEVVLALLALLVLAADVERVAVERPVGEGARRAAPAPPRRSRPGRRRRCATPSR